jgi:hypothetical protein
MLQLYTGLNDANFNSYGSYENMIFGLCFFSKYKNLHTMYKETGKISTTNLGGGKSAGDNSSGTQYHILDKRYGYVMSAHVSTLDVVESYIKKWGLGEFYRTPTFRNRKYSSESGSEIGVAVWHWNGTVPPIASTTLVNFPYNDEGQSKDAPVAQPNQELTPGKIWKINVA